MRWLLQQAFVVAFLAFQIEHTCSLHVVPKGTKASKLDIQNITTFRRKRKAQIQWVAGEPGQSCSDVCGPDCNDNEIHFIDTEQEVINIGLSVGHVCDTTLGFDFAEFPVIDVTYGHCSYRRPWSYVDSCDDPTFPRTHRFCKCGEEWYRGLLGESCTATCLREGGVCDEHALEKVNTVEKMIALSIQLGAPCDESKPIWAKEFPSQLPNLECAYTYGYESTCDEKIENMVRFCPCKEPEVDGDPHLTNIHGQTFDINREGVSTFLVYPRFNNSKTNPNTRLRVDAVVKHPGNDNKCTGWFVLHMLIKGSTVGKDIVLSTKGYEQNTPGALELTFGGKTLRNASEIAEFVKNGKYNMTFVDYRDRMKKLHLNNRLRFARLRLYVQKIQLEFTWSTGKRLPNALGFSAFNLKSFGEDWGGLLGGDDFTWVSQYDSDCKKSKNYNKIPQLVDEGPYQWTAMASMHERTI